FDIEVDKENGELTDAPTQIFFSADEIAQLTKDTPAPPDRAGPDTERPVVRLGEAGPVAPAARPGEAGPTHVPPSRQSVRTMPPRPPSARRSGPDAERLNATMRMGSVSAAPPEPAGRASGPPASTPLHSIPPPPSQPPAIPPGAPPGPVSRAA